MHHHAQSSRRRWPKRGWSGTRGAGLSGTAVGAAEEAETAHGAVVEAGAARGRNLGGTVGAERGAASGSNPGGTSGAGWQRCHSTCNGESGSNGGDRGARLTKKI
jgi:hypothetical protein